MFVKNSSFDKTKYFCDVQQFNLYTYEIYYFPKETNDTRFSRWSSFKFKFLRIIPVFWDL